MDISNNLIINYGKASISSQERTWIQPTLSGLTSYGTIAQTGNITNVWGIFNDSNTTLLMAGGLTNNITWEFPTRVTFTGFHIESVFTMGSNNGIGSASLYKLNSQNEWELATSTTFPGNTTKTYDAELTNFSTNKIKLVISSTNSAVNTGVRRCLFTGTETTYALNSVTFPQSFTTTNYSYSLAYQNGIFGNSYATDLTTTGMSLQNNSNGTNVYYLAIGY